MIADRTSFFGQTRPEFKAWIVDREFPEVHAKTIWSAVYLRGEGRFEQIATLPRRLVTALQESFFLELPPLAQERHSADGFTRKYLHSLEGGQQVESVLMRFSGRVTACVSSQAGCAMGCVFCATGQQGFSRHLSAAEIVGQVVHVDRVVRGSAAAGPALAKAGAASPHARHERLRNVVLMGMGEPLHNYDAVMQAIEVLRYPHGVAIGAEHFTLSTVGVVPGIRRLADEPRPVHLAVSLHAATQEERAALVPAARAWPLDELMEACRYYCAKRDRGIFFEWTLIEGRNDSPEEAHAVGRLLQGMQAQVNLIPLNPTSGFAGAPTRPSAAKRFQAVLAEYGLPSTVRQRRGIDVAAGCGQLAGAGTNRG